MTSITCAELARRLGRSRQAILKLAKAGRIPRNPDGTFDEMAVREAYAANVDPSRRLALPGAPPLPRPKPVPVASLEDARSAVSLVERVLAEEGRVLDGPPTYDDVKTAEMILRARERAQSLAILEGELIPKAPLLRQVEEAFSTIRKEVQSIPSRYGAQIAAECRCDVRRLDAALSAAIRDFLCELSGSVR